MQVRCRCSQGLVAAFDSPWGAARVRGDFKQTGQYSLISTWKVA